MAMHPSIIAATLCTRWIHFLSPSYIPIVLNPFFLHSLPHYGRPNSNLVARHLP
jgi:hypothetical protein